MGHYSHPVELSTDVSAQAVRRIRSSGAVVRMQGPVVHHVNDRAETLFGCHLEVVLWGATGRQLDRFARSVDVTADSAEVVGSLDWTLPSDGGWRLTCVLAQEGETLATNQYDLSEHDDMRPTLRQRLRIWLRDLVMLV